MRPRRVGLVGFGYIGRFVYEQIMRHPEFGLSIAFVHNRSPQALQDLPTGVVLPDLADFAARKPDLIVEMAHAAVNARYGEAFLRQADTMMLSVTALADATLENRLRRCCAAHGRQLFIPHGALAGADALQAGRDNWAEVTITFRKPPASLLPDGPDAERLRQRLADLEEPQVVYDGSVRGIAARFPQNVNTMVTCALATVGLDACRAVLVADPALDVLVAEVVAVGRDGARLEIKRSEPAAGVSGTGMLGAQLAAISRAVGGAPGFTVV